MDKKYYTVAEFAKKVGISRQAVYRAIDSNRLSLYVKEVDGKKYISETAFNGFVSKSHGVVDSRIIRLLDTLGNQLEEKDHQIADLSEQLKFKDEEIKRRSEEILELTKAFREAQALHAGTIQRELTDNSKRRWWKFWK